MGLLRCKRVVLSARHSVFMPLSLYIASICMQKDVIGSDVYIHDLVDKTSKLEEKYRASLLVARSPAVNSYSTKLPLGHSIKAFRSNGGIKKSQSANSSNCARIPT